MPDELHERIESICEQGSSAFDAGLYRPALVHFCEALDLVPVPLEDWEAATWIFTFIGDSLFFLESFEKSLDAFLNAVKCPTGLGNSFIHLRIGQNQFELGNLVRARDELARAYMGEGIEIFDGEDPKYLACLREVMELE